jgi:hypothetical protein
MLLAKPTSADPVARPAKAIRRAHYAVGGNPINGSTSLLNARVDAVAPEPSTFVLCGLGVIGLLASTVRRKRTESGTVG